MSKPIRIMLIDDHHLSRESWKSMLERDERFEFVAETDHGIQGIETAINLVPDIVLVDINMYPITGFEVVQEILSRNSSIRIIGISVNSQPTYASKLLELGAYGFVTKGSSLDEMTKAIITVHEGERYVCQEILSLII